MPTRRVSVLLALAAALLCFGRPALGQPGERCTLEVESAPGTETRAFGLSGEDYRIHIRGVVEATCGPSRVRADSAIYYEARGELYLYENVRYESGGRTLESDRATYFADEQRVIAEGDVRLTDQEGGSTLTGPVVHYYPATDARPLERIFAPDRPHLTVRGAEARDDPFEIDADRVHMYGDSVVAAAGRALGVRTDLTARADSMHMDRAGDRLWLLHEPVVEARGTTLEGDTVLVSMEERRVREIQAWPDASAIGDELALEAPAIRVFVEEDAITRVVAAPIARSAPEPPPGEEPVRREKPVEDDAPVDSVPEEALGAVAATDSPAVEDTVMDGQQPEPARQARSESSEYVLQADSLDVLRPAGRLDRVIAVGRARAVATEAVIPGDSVLGRDWIEGDTITGYFEPRRSAEREGQNGEDDTFAGTAIQDTIGPAQEEAIELVRLVATGDARALYHVREEQAEADPERPAINYVIGREITIWLDEGAARDVRVTGPGTGVYLEPLRPGELPDTAAADTAAADTAAADPAGADTAAADTTGARERSP